MHTLNWKKIGKIFELGNNFGWNKSHTQMPTPILLSDKIRIFYSTRDQSNQTSTSFFDVSADDPRKVVYVHDQPVIKPGQLGCFDDCGAMASSALKYNNQIYLYYIGWNVRNTVPFHNSIGLAIADGESHHFERYSAGPILDRGINNPLFCTTPFVMRKNNSWKMYYSSGSQWLNIHDSVESFYNIKQATSIDGVNWTTSPKFLFELDDLRDEGAAVRPSIIDVNGEEYMIYCKRSFLNYRGADESSYRFGLAIQDNDSGHTWKRVDNLLNCSSMSTTLFDSEMLCYPSTISVNGNQYMFYNGNNFGYNGIGLAIFEI